MDRIAAVTNEKFGTVSHLLPRGDAGVLLPPGTRAPDAALSFLRKYGELFQIKNVDQELTLEGTGGPDPLGITYASFTQKVGSVPVFGTRLSVQYDRNGRMSGVSGLFIPNLQLFPTTPALDAAAAIARARTHAAARYASSGRIYHDPITPPQLLIYADGEAPPLLTYRLQTSYSEVDDENRVPLDYFIDANSGRVLRSIDARRK
jgi:Zn-dependent metalloprotease